MNISAEIMATLLPAAVRYSGLPAVDLADLPPMEPVSAAVLSEKACPDSPERCTTIAALFDTENYRVYLRNTLMLDDAMDNSFIVHELVDVLQLKKFGESNFASCSKRVASEQQAHYVQNNYLGEQRIDWREGFLVRFMRCPNYNDESAPGLRQSALGDHDNL